jgi:choline dehydrogenase
MKLADNLAQTEPFASLVHSRIRPLPDITSETGLADYAREHAHTGYHPVGTCRMGTDPNAVVDTQCRLVGIEGLRIVDASVMPTLISGNTHAATVMIAEKIAAEIIRELY